MNFGSLGPLGVIRELARDAHFFEPSSIVAVCREKTSVWNVSFSNERASSPFDVVVSGGPPERVGERGCAQIDLGTGSERVVVQRGDQPLAEDMSEDNTGDFDPI